MDWDDTQLAEGPGRPYGLLMHPTVPPLAAALAVSDLVAVAEGRAVDGKRFLTAFNAGFEVACKIAEAINPDHRSDERRVGKEGVSTCRSRWTPDHEKIKAKLTHGVYVREPMYNHNSA